MTKYSPESNKSPIRTYFGEQAWEKVRKENGLPELSAQSKANLAEANRLLETHSLVIYANHPSKNDAVIAVALAMSGLSNAKRFLAPAGMRHYDLGRDFVSGILLRALRILNIHMIPVVQKSDSESYPPAQRERLLARLKARTEKLFAQQGSVYGITPEGTRSGETGEIRQANTGIAQLEKYASKDKPLVYLPVAIILNKFSQNPEVVIGKPQMLAQVIESLEMDIAAASLQQVADMHMYRLAALMPEHLRGHYRSES